MPKITSVELQKKTLRLVRLRSPQVRSGQGLHRFNIFLDGQFVFGADEDLVVDYRLVVGKDIDSKLLEKLLFETEVGKLMEKMYNLFNIRQRSEKEVRDYLKNLSFKRKLKGEEEISVDAVNLLIDKLKNKRLLDDEQFARSWVETRRKSKKKGIKALRVELFQRGINKEIVDRVLSEQSEIFNEEQLAYEALAKKIRLWSNLPYLQRKQKAYQFLARKGFEYPIIRDAVAKILKKE